MKKDQQVSSKNACTGDPGRRRSVETATSCLTTSGSCHHTKDPKMREPLLSILFLSHSYVFVLPVTEFLAFLGSQDATQFPSVPVSQRWVSATFNLMDVELSDGFSNTWPKNSRLPPSSPIPNSLPPGLPHKAHPRLCPSFGQQFPESTEL